MARRARWFVILILLGAAANVAVSWGCATLVYAGTADRIAASVRLGGPDSSWHLASYRRPGAVRVHSVWGPMPRREEAEEIPAVQLLALTHGRSIGPPAKSTDHPGAVIFDARGWPWPSMWSVQHVTATVAGSADRRWIQVGDVERVRAGVALSAHPRVQSEAVLHQHRVLPLGIVWPGFVANTFLYALVLLVAMVLLQRSRRVVRVGAGRCPGCSYDVREAPRGTCPERGLVRPGLGAPSLPARLARRVVQSSWLILGVLACVAVFRLGRPVVISYDWDSLKPTFWLISTACGDDTEGAASALSELIGRIKSGRIPDGDVESLIGSALEIQAKTDQPWVPEWGDLVMAARDREVLNDDDWTRFVSQSVVPEVLVRSEVVQDERLRPRVLEAVQLRVLQLRTDRVIGGDHRLEWATGVHGQFDFVDPPLPLAFDVFVLAHGEEFFLDHIDSEQEHPWHFVGTFQGVADIKQGETVDLLLRSSPVAARRTLRTQRIWGGDLLFEDVDVQWKTTTRLSGTPSMRSMPRRRPRPDMPAPTSTSTSLGPATVDAAEHRAPPIRSTVRQGWDEVRMWCVAGSASNASQALSMLAPEITDLELIALLWLATKIETDLSQLVARSEHARRQLRMAGYAKIRVTTNPRGSNAPGER